MRVCTVYSNIVYDNLALSQNVISRTDELRATKDCIPHLELRFRQPFISISVAFSRCDISLLIAIIFYCIISLSSCPMSHVYASPRMGINESECAEKKRADWKKNPFMIFTESEAFSATTIIASSPLWLRIVAFINKCFLLSAEFTMWKSLCAADCSLSCAICS